LLLTGQRHLLIYECIGFILFLFLFILFEFPAVTIVGAIGHCGFFANVVTVTEAVNFARPRSCPETGYAVIGA
jgi:hypothetical protein